MYLVKREVRATSIEKAARERGVIYEITMAGKEFQPEENNKKVGFGKKKI